MTPLSSPPRSLAGFPTHVLPEGAELWRIHHRSYGPWWFGGGGAGRFDLSAPRGTCYLAGDPLGAFVEVFRDTVLIAEEDVRFRRLSRVALGRSLRLADCTSRQSRGFGVTAAIHSGSDYDLTQRWAREFDAAGFDGVRYLVRHDPAQGLVGVALFGEAGEPGGSGDRLHKILATDPIDRALLDRVEAETGLQVLPVA